LKLCVLIHPISQLLTCIFSPKIASKFTFSSLLPYYLTADLEWHSLLMPQINYCFFNTITDFDTVCL